MYGLYQSNKLTDIRVECGDETFCFHKPVLAFSSGYFQKLLTDKPDTVSHKLDFPIEPTTFRILATSFYTGVVELSETNDAAIDLLQASFFLEAHYANAQIVSFLMTQLSIDNCLDTYLASDYSFDAALKTKSTAKVGRHLSEVASTNKTFLDLQSDKLVELLSDDGLQVPNEMVVYEAAIAWIKHDLTNRQQDLFSVLNVVRFQYLSKDYLTEVVAEEQLVLNNNDVMGLYSKALQYKLRSPRASTQAKRRDFFRHSVVGGCEKFAKQQQQVATLRVESEDPWKHFINVHVVFPFQYFQTNIWNKYIATPVLTWTQFCKEDVVEKHITGPLSRTPCMLPQGDNDEEAIPGVPKENVLEKYIVRPIMESPCIPDSDDEYEEHNANLLLVEETKEQDEHVDVSILQDSVWTNIENAANQNESSSKLTVVAMD